MTSKSIVSFFFVVICSLAAWTGLCGNLSKENLKLQYVQLLWRHGDRSPVVIYPNDPNAQYWPQGEGILTQTGMRQHYALGEYFKNRYGGSLVSQHYFKNETFIYSSHVDRAIESASSNLAAFYKPTDWQVFKTDLPWQPVPVHTIPESLDHILDVQRYKCPKWIAIDKQFQQSQEFQTMNTTYHDLFVYLTGKTGSDVNIENVGLIFDNFICTKAHNLELPKWVTPEIMKNISVVGDFVFFNFFRTKEQQKLLGGGLLKLIRDNFQNVRTGQTSSLLSNKLIIYSAHDTTVMALTTLLDVFNEIKPPYAASIIMELYSDENKKFYLKMMYRNESTSEPHPLKMEVCNYEELCNWDTFYANTESLTVENWDIECRIHDHELV